MSCSRRAGEAFGPGRGGVSLRGLLPQSRRPGRCRWLRPALVLAPRAGATFALPASRHALHAVAPLLPLLPCRTFRASSGRW